MKNTMTLLMRLQEHEVLDEFHCGHLTTRLRHACACGYIRDITPDEIDTLLTSIGVLVQDTTSPVTREGLSEELFTCAVHMIIDANLEDLARTNDRLLVQVFKAVANVAKRPDSTTN